MCVCVCVCVRVCVCVSVCVCMHVVFTERKWERRQRARSIKSSRHAHAQYENTSLTEPLRYYGIAGNFEGENLRGLLTFTVPKDATSQNFAEKTFANNCEIHKSFLLRKFPTIR